ncbi:MAG: hypothetical protein JWO92_1057 [Chitinophagaceae bacterium]|nr:hypothetical protein [Chitinophagaceae bacterium]
MHIKQITLPQQGDLLFEREPLLKGQWYLFAIVYYLLSIYVIYHIVHNGLRPYIFTFGFGGFAFIMTGIYLVLFIKALINGFSNNTYKAFYFPDKIVFHIISKELDESYSRSGQSHIIELPFKDIRYFINEDHHIKVIPVDPIHTDYFFTELNLAKKYKKSKSEIVDFLNIGIKSVH